MSLFTRSYLVLIVLLFAAFFVSLVIIDNLFEVEDGRVFKAESSAETALALNWLADHPRREWPKAVRQYRSVLDYDVEVLSSSEFAEQKELLPALRAPCCALPARSGPGRGQCPPLPVAG